MKKLLFILLLFPLLCHGQTISFSASSQTASPGSVVTINSGTYTNNRTYIFLICSFAASTPTDNPTISSGGLTLTKRGTTTGSFNDRWIVYTANVTGGDVTTSITFTYAESQNTKITAIYYTDYNGSNQYEVAGNTGTGADPSITFTARTASIVCGFSNNQNPFGGTPESGWTEDDDAGSATPIGRYLMHRSSTTDNTPIVTASASNWTGIALSVYALRRRIIID
jgi:hypothetical protein